MCVDDLFGLSFEVISVCCFMALNKTLHEPTRCVTEKQLNETKQKDASFFRHNENEKLFNVSTKVVEAGQKTQMIVKNFTQ